MVVEVGAADAAVFAVALVGEGAVVAEVDDVLAGAVEEFGGVPGGEEGVGDHFSRIPAKRK